MNKSPSLENVTSNLSACGKLEIQNKRGNFSNHVWIIQHNPCVEISNSHMVIEISTVNSENGKPYMVFLWISKTCGEISKQNP